jgi:hypothetical protein
MSASIAILIAADGEDPALLAAISFGESRLVATAHNACCAGPMAVRGFHVEQGEVAGYRAGVRVLRQARAWCARRGTPTERCMLAAFAGGPALVRRGTYTGRRALARRDAIRRSMGGRPGAVPREGATS